MEESNNNPVTRAFQTMAADTPSLMGSAVRPAEPLGLIPGQGGQSTIAARRRANSTLPELGSLSQEGSYAVPSKGQET